MAGGLDLSGDVGKHELNALEARDRRPELMALLDVIERVLERTLCDPERLGADARPRAVEHRQGDLEACALFAKPVRGRDLDVLEDQLGGRRAANAQLVLELGRLPRARLALQHE